MKYLLFLLLISLTVSVTLFATDEFRWGGPGYDPALKGQPSSSRFSVRSGGYSKNEKLIEIIVDSQETAEETEKMCLASPDRQEACSIDCSKEMKHADAPWACRFAAADIKKLSGQGKIVVKGGAGKDLLQDAVDLDRLRALVAESDK